MLILPETTCFRFVVRLSTTLSRGSGHGLNTRSDVASIFGTLYQPQLWAESANNVIAPLIADILGNKSNTTTERYL